MRDYKDLQTYLHCKNTALFIPGYENIELPGQLTISLEKRCDMDQATPCDASVQHLTMLHKLRVEAVGVGTGGFEDELAWG